MSPRKTPKISKLRRRQIIDLWVRISSGEIAEIEQALAAIPIEQDDPEYVIVRAVLSLFLERGPTLLGNFDIYSEMAYLFAEVILENTPLAVVSLMHIKALLIDSSRLLISSANFTHSGMTRNIEFGICTDGHAAMEARTVLSQLLKSSLCEKI